MNTLKVSFYNIITRTRLRAMLDNLASVLELAISQLLHLNDYGIRVSISPWSLFYFLPKQDEVF